MGQLEVKQLKTPDQKANYIHFLIKDLKALDYMLKADMFEKTPIRIGAEQEFCLTNRNYFPGDNCEVILAAINDDHFTTEIGQYNLEINSDPLILKGKCFTKLYKSLHELLTGAEKVANENDTKVILTGILPTLRLKHISEKYMTNKPRYHVLNESIKASRGEHFSIHIKGTDELNLNNDCVMLEACNTSFQTHLQINPDEFVQKYNWAQAIAGPVLASCTNSPILFGRELWAETRIALFTQSIDTRANSFIHKEKQSRVSFGEEWERGTVTDIFKDHISRFTSLLTASEYQDSLADLEEGKTPKLKALQLHNGTVYKWNRVCYGTGGGKPHLRIECRYIPSGPTLIDEIATMAFWVGLMMGQPKKLTPIDKKMDFKDAKNNFFKAARNGIETQFWWGGKLVSAKKLLLKELLPLAKKGLSLMNVDDSDIKHYLNIVKNRINKQTGSQWLISNYRALQKEKTNFEALQDLTSYMHKHQFLEEGISAWPSYKELKPTTRQKASIVKHKMNTKILLVEESDSLELVVNIMKWKKIHHLPVINKEKELTGLLTWTDIIMLNEEDLKSPVKDVMTKNIITISQEKPLKEAERVMQTHNINCLPVVRNKELLGIITTTDL